MASKYDKIEKAKKGEFLEEVPVSLWRHFPIDDLRAESLCARHLELLRKYDLDLVKFSITGGYSAVAYGCEIEYVNTLEGAARVKKPVINDLTDWERLEEVDVQTGILGEMLRGVKLYSKKLDEEVPFVVTVFSPLTTASKISGNLFLKHLRTEPKIIHQALNIIKKTTTEFSKAIIENGASGVFFATQQASYDLLSIEEFKTFGLKYDLPVLKAVQDAFFNVLHLHGLNVMFDLATASYPVSAVNWHDRLTPPTLRDALNSFDGVLVGGLNELETLTIKQPKDVREEVLDAAAQTGRKRLIIGPGCVIPLNASEGNMEEVVKAARTLPR